MVFFPRVWNFLPATLSAALLVGLVTSQATASAAPRKPNFIVVFCDNLGYGDVEPFGSTLHRTPNLNRMAKEGSLDAQAGEPEALRPVTHDTTYIIPNSNLKGAQDEHFRDQRRH